MRFTKAGLGRKQSVLAAQSKLALVSQKQHLRRLGLGAEWARNAQKAPDCCRWEHGNHALAASPCTWRDVCPVRRKQSVVSGAAAGRFRAAANSPLQQSGEKRALDTVSSPCRDWRSLLDTWRRLGVPRFASDHRGLTVCTGNPAVRARERSLFAATWACEAAIVQPWPALLPRARVTISVPFVD